MHDRNEFYDPYYIDVQPMRKKFEDQFLDTVNMLKDEFWSIDLFHQYRLHNINKEYCKVKHLLMQRDLTCLRG